MDWDFISSYAHHATPMATNLSAYVAHTLLVWGTLSSNTSNFWGELKRYSRSSTPLWEQCSGYDSSFEGLRGAMENLE